MIKKLPTTCVLLCLLLSVACTSDPKPSTPQPTAARHYCPLTPCRLPARQVLVVNDDWRRALDEAEGELLNCAGQVLDCIERQAAQVHK